MLSTQHWRTRLQETVRAITLHPYYILFPLSLLLVGIAIASLRWRMELDPPQNLAYSYLIDHYGYVPYRDFYEQNMPGVYFIYILVGRMIGYTNDFLFEVFNLFYLGAIFAVTWLWLRKFGRPVAWGAIVLFGLYYLGRGYDPSPIMSKEYFVLLPIALAALLATNFPNLKDPIRSFIVGFLFGLVFIVRPNGGIGLPVVLVFMVLEIKHRSPDNTLSLRQVLLWLVCAGVGFGVPVGATLVYLVRSGAWPYFVEIAENYWPLYTGFNSELEILHGAERTRWILETFPKFNDHPLWLIPAFVGCFAAFYPAVLDAGRRRQVLLALSLMVGYALYTLVAAAFSSNQWIPFMYFMIVLCSLCFLAPHPDASLFVKWFPVTLLVMAMLLRVDFLPGIVREISGFAEGVPQWPLRGGRVDAIAAYLREHAEPGDRVQPLDVSDSVMHALMLADIQPANRFAMDLMFFHDVGNPYIQRLREEFIQDLGNAPPRFIIEIYGNPFIQGPDVSPFYELPLFVDANYQVAFAGDTYFIYERTSLDDPGIRRVVVAYPYNPGMIADWFPEAAHLDVVPVTSDLQADTEALGARLGEIARTHQLVTLEIFTAQGTDPSQTLERWANQNLFKLSERRIKDARVIEYLSGPPDCSEVVSQQATFGDLITLNSAGVATVMAGSQRFVCLRLEWQADRAVEKSYKVAAHVFNQSGELVAQYDSVPGGYLTPTDTWVVGQPVPDQFAIQLPAGLPPGQYEVRIVVYDEASSARLRVTSEQGQPDTISIGRFEVVGQ